MTWGTKNTFCHCQLLSEQRHVILLGSAAREGCREVAFEGREPGPEHEVGHRKGHGDDECWREQWW